LLRKYKYRKMKMHFDNTVKKDSAPKQYTGKLVFEMVKNIEVVFRKGTVNGQKRQSYLGDQAGGCVGYTCSPFTPPLAAGAQICGAGGNLVGF
jgi:hypothetical protein